MLGKVKKGIALADKYFKNTSNKKLNRKKKEKKKYDPYKDQTNIDEYRGY